MRPVFRVLTWLSRGFLALIFLVSAYDLVRFSMNPSAYPIPSTEVGDPRYSSASRFMWTSSIDGAIALTGLLLWLFWARRRARMAAAVASIVCAAVLILQARIAARL
jgi:hypothetical protein